MSIKLHLEQAIKSLEAEKEREANIVKDKVMKEKIIPFNQEIDIAREKAIAELQSSLNSTILAHQEKFAKDKQIMIEAGEKKKQENAAMVLATETSVVTIKYDKAIAKLKEQIEDINE